jgi:hypothetical protein
MAAKLPDNLIEPPPRRLSELQVGETAYVSARHMGVTEGGECFLDTQAEITERNFGTIKVDRREDGYHVTVIAKGTKWRRHILTKERPVPVASIREEYDPKLDEEAHRERLREIQRGMGER